MESGSWVTSCVIRGWRWTSCAVRRRYSISPLSASTGRCYTSHSYVVTQLRHLNSMTLPVADLESSVRTLFSPHGIAMLKGYYFTAAGLSFFFLLFSMPNL